ncbi:hypothetical protein HZA97_01345 [Candidatus Woesearchaeota archaeon]|nr:hypothetical protein [Candidatus Woesearchaeota archaeon]
MEKLSLDVVIAKAETRKEALKDEGKLHDKEVYHNMKGWKTAEATRTLYLTAITNVLKEMEDAIRSGNGYRINDAEIALRLIYDLAEKVTELHEE